MVGDPLPLPLDAEQPVATNAAAAPAAIHRRAPLAFRIARRSVGQLGKPYLNLRAIRRVKSAHAGSLVPAIGVASWLVTRPLTSVTSSVTPATSSVTTSVSSSVVNNSSVVGLVVVDLVVVWSGSKHSIRLRPSAFARYRAWSASNSTSAPGRFDPPSRIARPALKVRIPRARQARS